MKKQTFNNVSFMVDDGGWIENPNHWVREFSEYTAEKDGIQLTTEHWKLIETARRYFDKYHCVEAERLICKEAGLRKLSVHHLFDGSMREFEKVAGLYQTWATD